MKSFKYILANKTLPLTLLIHEMFFYFFIFVGFVALFMSVATNKMFSYDFSISYFMAFKNGAINGTVILYFLVLAFIFSIIYFVFITGIFFGLSSDRKMKFSELVLEGISSFFRFLLIFVVFIIITLILSGLLSTIFSKLSNSTFNTKLPLYYTLIKTILLGVILSVLSYLQTKTRFLYVKESRLKFFNKLNLSEFFRFFGYQVLSLLSLAVGVFFVYKILLLNGIFWGIIGVVIFQVLFFFRVVFKLAAYKTIIIDN